MPRVVLSAPRTLTSLGFALVRVFGGFGRPAVWVPAALLLFPSSLLSVFPIIYSLEDFSVLDVGVSTRSFVMYNIISTDLLLYF